MKDAKNSMLSYMNHFKRFTNQLFQPLAKKYQLTQLEIGILLFLHNNPSYNTARDIAEVRGFAKSNVSTALDALQRKQYLTAEPDSANRKIRRIRLLAAAAPCVEELARCQQEGFARVLAGFTQEERDLWWSFMQRMDQNLLRDLEEVQEEKEGK